jgi:hypothetical protein
LVPRDPNHRTLRMIALRPGGERIHAPNRYLALVS